MRSFIEKQKVYVKSKNSTRNIQLNFTYSLILFTILAIIADIVFNNGLLCIPLIKSIVCSILSVSIFDYIINVILKKYDISKIYIDDNIEQLGIIIGLFGIELEIPVLLVATLLSVIVKKVFKKINISSALYGILLIYLYKYYNMQLITPLTNLKEMAYFGTYDDVVVANGNIIYYLFNIRNLSPIIAIVMFLYLFYRKSIKYNIVVSYTLTVFIMMLLYGIFNGMNVWFGFFEFLTGGLTFFSIYGLADYQMTPTIGQSQVLYGILLGIVTVILRFIIPEISVIVVTIVCPILFTNIIEKLSPNFKYNTKLYYFAIFVLLLLAIISICSLTFLIGSGLH